MRAGMRALLIALALVACGPTTHPLPRPTSQSTPALQAPPASVRVDHVWVKDAPTTAARAAQREALETLRQRVAAGASFTAAWTGLGIDGDLWHVAENETYPYDVISEGARDLPVGALSPILPGNGGLHLFRILARELAP